MAFAFEKLVVDQKAVDFADSICAGTENLAVVTAFSRFSSIAPQFRSRQTSAREMDASQRLTVAPSKLLEPLASVLREPPCWLSIRSSC